MKQRLKLLLLAGSFEARQMAQMLDAQGVDLRALMSEPPRGTQPMAVPCDLRVFDDVADLAAYMAPFDAVLDASHGFDGAMTQLGLAAARVQGLPFLSYARPAWDVAAHPRWRSAPDVGTAMPMISAGARVFSAAGWGSLADCAAFPGARLFVRQTTQHARPAPYDFIEPVFGIAPFDVAGEVDLFTRYQIDTLMCRNLGGEASRPKLDAAAALDLGVILIDRPAHPDPTCVVREINAALDWVAAL